MNKIMIRKEERVFWVRFWKLPWAWGIGYGCGIVWFGYTPAGCGGYLLRKYKIKTFEIRNREEEKNLSKSLNKIGLPWLWLWHWIAMHNGALWNWIPRWRWYRNRCRCHYYWCCKQNIIKAKNNRLVFHRISKNSRLVSIIFVQLNFDNLVEWCVCLYFFYIISWKSLMNVTNRFRVCAKISIKIDSNVILLKQFIACTSFEYITRTWYVTAQFWELWNSYLILEEKNKLFVACCVETMTFVHFFRYCSNTTKTQTLAINHGIPSNYPKKIALNDIPQYKCFIYRDGLKEIGEWEERKKC